MKLVRKMMPLAVASALSSWSAGVQPAGFALSEQNASGLGNAYTGQAAAAENASTIFWNPAGMTKLPGRQVSGAINAILPSNEFSNSGGSAAPLGFASPGGNGGDAGDWGFVPNAYLSWQVSPQWWVGLGITVPFGLKTEYDQGWFGRFQSQRAEIKTIDVNPSVAFKLSDAVSLGGGFSYQKAELKIDRSAAIPPNTFGPGSPALEAATQLRLDDDSWGWNLGALFTIGTGTRIGITYRSSVEYDLSGTSVVSRLPAAVGGTAANGVTANVKLPDSVSWGIAHPINRAWELLGDITWTNWSKIKAVPFVATTASVLRPVGATLDTFNLQFKDGWRVGVGANWNWRDDFQVKFGVAYDKTPVTDEFRTPFLPDQDRTWLAIGGKYRMSKQATLDFGYAYLFVKDASINQQKGIVTAPLQGNIIGNYESNVNIISAQLTYSF